MTKTYQLSGMTCQGCVSSVQKIVSRIEGVESVDVSLDPQEIRITSTDEIPIGILQEEVGQSGKYTLSAQPLGNLSETEFDEEDKAGFFRTYRPLLTIVAYLLVVTILPQLDGGGFAWQLWMRHFMAGFFLIFSFFKLLNIRGFADSYRMYDVVARKWNGWGKIYPFVELGLGIAYLINFNPVLVNWVTVIVLGISAVGVIEANLNKKRIRCACLGDVFNLPMSTVTIVEDVTMVAMAAIMLARL